MGYRECVSIKYPREEGRIGCIWKDLDKKFSTIAEGHQFSDPSNLVNSTMIADGKHIVQNNKNKTLSKETGECVGKSNVYV